MAETNAIADHGLAKRGGKLWRKIANLVGVRKQNQVRLSRFNHLLQRDTIPVRGVILQQVVFDQQHFRDILSRKFVGKSGDAFTENHSTNTARTRRGNLLRGHQRFKTGGIEFPLALFGND